jgi:hypothetical protein
LSDIFWLLRNNEPPRSRFGMQVVTQGTSVYYAFRP